MNKWKRIRRLSGKRQNNFSSSEVSTMAEMRKVTLAKVSTLHTTMWKLYDGFVTVHKAVVCVHGL